MPYILHLYFSRKPGLSPSAFQSHFENRHIPLIQGLAGDLFPQTHTRWYTQRSEEDGEFPATVLVGTQQDVDYDAMAQLVFEDEAAFQKFYAIRKDKEILRQLEEDDERFVDKAKTRAVVMGNCAVTKGPLSGEYVAS